MQIQINTDKNIHTHAAFNATITARIENDLARLSDRISRLEIHLSDENGAKSGQNDKRCLIEVRLEGRKPVSVSHDSVSVEKAIDGAVDKVLRMVERTLDRHRDRLRRSDETK
ncbi:MAG: HPF/RaiA family ribosome-associated protein [Bacteroidota bacterium]